MLRSVCDLLSSPVNLVRKGLTEEQECKVCEGKRTLQHILSGWEQALAQGRYTWRHDKALMESATILETERKRKRTTQNEKQYGESSKSKREAIHPSSAKHQRADI